MRCWMPTDRSPTIASGSISKPSCVASWRMRPSDLWRSRKTGLAIVSLPSTMFSATENTGTSMKCWWTMPMPRAIASDGPRSPRVCRRAGSRPRRGEQPVQDVHQRALAGAVLAEQGVDLAGPDRQVDAVVGDDARESLGDAAHLQGRRQPRRGDVRVDRDAACGDVGRRRRPAWLSADHARGHRAPRATARLVGGVGFGGTSATSASSHGRTVWA